MRASREREREIESIVLGFRTIAAARLRPVWINARVICRATTLTSRAFRLIESRLNSIFMDVSSGRRCTAV